MTGKVETTGKCECGRTLIVLPDGSTSQRCLLCALAMFKAVGFQSELSDSAWLDWICDVEREYGDDRE